MLTRMRRSSWMILKVCKYVSHNSFTCLFIPPQRRYGGILESGFPSVRSSVCLETQLRPAFLSYSFALFLLLSLMTRRTCAPVIYIMVRQVLPMYGPFTVGPLGLTSSFKCILYLQTTLPTSKDSSSSI